MIFAYWKISWMSGLEACVPSRASPEAGSSRSLTELTTKGTSEGLVARKSTSTMEAWPLLTGRTRTLRIFPSRRRCAPVVVERRMNSRTPTAASPAGRTIRNRLVTSIAQQPSIGLQAADVIAHRFKAGGDGNGQHQPDGAPQHAPEHERDGDHQGVQVHASADELGIHEIQRQQMEHGHADGQEQKHGGSA